VTAGEGRGIRDVPYTSAGVMPTVLPQAHGLWHFIIRAALGNGVLWLFDLSALVCDEVSHRASVDGHVGVVALVK